jgi:hypothetical protein
MHRLLSTWAAPGGSARGSESDLDQWRSKSYCTGDGDPDTIDRGGTILEVGESGRLF